MKVKPRLTRLEATVPMGCVRCRHWGEVVLLDDAGNSQRPERCPTCGRLVPIRTTVHIVGVALDLV